ncbi:MAG: acyl-CoA dehydrogenase family protein [Deltaproteobacteria bacterium]|nr:acyl-CoA dehydrogenase family protein [Deltaproteobacteria bacterium]
MLSYDLTPEQEMLRKTVRDFAEKEIKPVAQKIDEKEEFSYDLVKKMGELGLFGVTVSPDYGGQGLDTLSYILIVEELARVDGCQSATVAAENGLGIGPIYNFGSQEQKQKYLPDLCSGKKLWGFGLTEPNAGSDAGNSATRGELKNGEWTINGSKIFITNAASKITAGVTVQCVTGQDAKGTKEISCVIVEAGTSGFTAREMHHKMTWRSSNTGELYFDNVRVPEKNLLGKEGDGYRQMLATLDGGRLAIAAMGLGGAQGAFEAALKYSKERKTFGKSLSEHQVIAFKLADMATEIEIARTFLYKACWLKDQGRSFKKEAAMAKLYTSEMMGRVADAAVQIHGGYGLMEEYPVAKFYRDQRLLEIGEGTSEVQRIVIARQIGC